MKRYLSISKKWIHRSDSLFSPKHLLFNICLNEKYEISPFLSKTLSIFESKQLTIHGVWEILSKNKNNITYKEFNQLINALITMKILSYKVKSTASHRIYPAIHNLSERKIPIASTPYEVELHITNACNLRCVHCGYNAGVPLKNELNALEWCKVIDELESLRTLRVIISGGEPLMHREVKQIIKHLRKKRISVIILSNGTLVDEDIACLLASENIQVNISLDGGNAYAHDSIRGTGCFDLVYKKLLLLAKKGVRINLDTTLHKGNLNQIDEVIKVGLRVGAISVIFGTMFAVGRAKNQSDLQLVPDDIAASLQDLGKLKENYKDMISISFVNPLTLEYRDMNPSQNSLRIYCPGGTTRLAIRSDGGIFPCQYGFIDDAYLMGSVRLRGVGQVWCSKVWNKFRGEVVKETLHNCRICDQYDSCVLKTCRLMAYAAKKDFYASPPGCEWIWGKSMF